MQIALAANAIPAAAVWKRGLRMLLSRQRPDVDIPCWRLNSSWAAIQLQSRHVAMPAAAAVRYAAGSATSLYCAGC